MGLFQLNRKKIRFHTCATFTLVFTDSENQSTKVLTWIFYNIDFSARLDKV